MGWTVHYLNAHGRLDSVVAPIGQALEAARRKVEPLVGPVDVDIIVQHRPAAIIAERGFGGYSPSGDLIELSFDPANDNLPQNLGLPLQRLTAHELHHVLRWRGPGYGDTLGEALVTEGLAGHFAAEVFGGGPEPWEMAVPRERLAAYLGRVEALWEDATYDHFEWFYGEGQLPRWLGYSLGSTLVGRALKATGASALGWAREPATTVRPFLKGMCG